MGVVLARARQEVEGFDVLRRCVAKMRSVHESHVKALSKISAELMGLSSSPKLPALGFLGASAHVLHTLLQSDIHEASRRVDALSRWERPCENWEDHFPDADGEDDTGVAMVESGRAFTVEKRRVKRIAGICSSLDKSERELADAKDAAGGGESAKSRKMKSIYGKAVRGHHVAQKEFEDMVGPTLEEEECGARARRWVIRSLVQEVLGRGSGAAETQAWDIEQDLDATSALMESELENGPRGKESSSSSSGKVSGPIEFSGSIYVFEGESSSDLEAKASWIPHWIKVRPGFLFICSDDADQALQRKIPLRSFVLDTAPAETLTVRDRCIALRPAQDALPVLLSFSSKPELFVWTAALENACSADAKRARSSLQKLSQSLRASTYATLATLMDKDGHLGTEPASSSADDPQVSSDPPPPARPQRPGRPSRPARPSRASSVSTADSSLVVDDLDLVIESTVVAPSPDAEDDGGGCDGAPKSPNPRPVTMALSAESTAILDLGSLDVALDELDDLLT